MQLPSTKKKSNRAVRERLKGDTCRLEKKKESDKEKKERKKLTPTWRNRESRELPQTGKG